jgi:Pyruvate/2-oxoacid:ferredoxin oxidoreductase gamma subunit
MLGLDNVSAIAGRAEEYAHQAEYRQGFDVVTARAVAALPVLCELCLPFARVGGKMIANTQKINPMPVITGAAKYPEGIMETLDAKVDLCALDALALAKEAGNVKAVNVVLMGVMAKSTNIPYETWVTAVRECVPAKFLDANLRAFDAGYHYAKES